MKSFTMCGKVLLRIAIVKEFLLNFTRLIIFQQTEQKENARLKQMRELRLQSADLKKHFHQ
jgi:hypothetical protein